MKIQKLTPETQPLIVEEYRVLRDFSSHPNLPAFYGVYRRRSGKKTEYDQIWFVMEASNSLSLSLSPSFPKKTHTYPSSTLAFPHTKQKPAHISASAINAALDVNGSERASEQATKPPLAVPRLGFIVIVGLSRKPLSLFLTYRRAKIAVNALARSVVTHVHSRASERARTNPPTVALANRARPEAISSI